MEIQTEAVDSDVRADAQNVLHRYPAPLVAFALAATLRALYTALAGFAVPYLLLLPAFITGNHFTEHLMTPAAGLQYALLGVWERLDTLNYIHIAQFGYNEPFIVVFYPVYPLLIRLLTPVFGSALLTALVISSVAAFFLFWGLLLLFRLDLPEKVAIRTLVFYALWPASFILFCGYVESLVLALVVWSIYFARTGRLWLAGLLGFFAPLSKAIGIIVVPALAGLAVRERRWRNLWAALPLAGAAAYPLWLHLSGHPQPWQAYPVFWQTKSNWPWITVIHAVQTLLHLLQFGGLTSPVQVAMRAGWGLFFGLQLCWMAIVFALALSRRLRMEYLLYGAAGIWIVLMKDSEIAQQQWIRYMLMLFPAAIAFSVREKDSFLFAASTVLLFLFNLLLLWFFLQWILVL